MITFPHHDNFFHIINDCFHTTFSCVNMKSHFFLLCKYKVTFFFSCVNMKSHESIVIRHLNKLSKNIVNLCFSVNLFDESPLGH